MEGPVMGFYDNLDSLQSQMLHYLVDYARSGNYHPLVKYEREDDMLYFKNHSDEWVDEYASDIWLIAEIADSVNARTLLVDMANVDMYSEYLEYDECNDSLILRLDDKEVGEDACPWALNAILDNILFNN